MYSPKIREELIPRIYRAAKAAGVARTTWVNQLNLPEPVEVNDFLEIRRKFPNMLRLPGFRAWPITLTKEWLFICPVGGNETEPRRKVSQHREGASERRFAA
jgi:hypothetical protein